MLTQKQAERLLLLGRPFSPVYALMVRLRRRLYSAGILKAGRLDCLVVSVGNLTLGGTGKTPHVISICSHLVSAGHRPCVLTRGYGGEAGKGPVVVSDGSEVVAPVHVAGDEAWMMARRLPGVPVVAGSDRYSCGRFALERFSPSVVVLDDGFQHLRLHRDVDLVLLEATAPFGSERVFPGGILREPLDALNAADAAVITKCNEVSDRQAELVEARVSSRMRDRPVFRSSYRLDGVTVVCGGGDARGDEQAWQDGSVVCFCGLARPESFLRLLQRSGVQVAGHVWFPDHHFYTGRDIERIGRLARRKGCSTVLTTEKDFAKIACGEWNETNRGIRLAVVALGLDIQQEFFGFLTSRIGKPVDRHRTGSRN